MTPIGYYTGYSHDGDSGVVVVVKIHMKGGLVFVNVLPVQTP